MVCHSRRCRTGARIAVASRRWIGVVQPKPLKFKSHADVSYLPPKRWMSFSTKSSRDTLGDWMSLQANVTFKTISLSRTHDSERNTLPRKQHARNSTTV